jgi:hypothetical protein
MKERLVKVVLKVARMWPFRLLASRMLFFKAMNRDIEAMNAAIAAMRAATAATDAATAAVNAAAAATAALNLSSAASDAANEPIFNWYKDFPGGGSLPVCPNRQKRTSRGIRSFLPVRR